MVLGSSSRQGAKHAKFGIGFFFAAFAPLREILRRFSYLATARSA
jgi:hypothetical protein